MWLDENGVRRPRAARHALVALAVLGRRGRYAARREAGGKVVTGPVGAPPDRAAIGRGSSSWCDALACAEPVSTSSASALALRDAEAEIRFVYRVASCGGGEAPS